jgi:carbamoyltransferase
LEQGVNILGISGFSHDAAAALLCDGQIVAAAEEERFDRVKHSAAFPRHAINWCLAHAGLTQRDVDVVAFYSQPWRGFGAPASHFVRGLADGTTAHACMHELLPRVQRNLRPSLSAAHLAVSARRVCCIEHHLAHAASAFFLSPFDEAAIFTVDRFGEMTTTLLAYGAGNVITPLARVAAPHSLGGFYKAITHYLGFHQPGDEGKVMGLAPYGRPRFQDHFSRWVRLTNGGFRLDVNAIRLPVGPDVISALGPPRDPGEPLTERHADVAASLQHTLERALLHLVNHLHAITGASNLCMAGGVALNCVANSRIIEEGPFRQMWVQPAANDSGTSLGAALWVHHVLNGQPRASTMAHAYLGPAYDEEACRASLQARGLPASRPADLSAAVACLLARGDTVGWFQGRMEFGPRALGNRSILADPRRSEMKDVLNTRVKHREPFRPFAPAVLAERAGDYFDAPTSSPFMLFARRVTQPDAVPAITHVDGTARLQTVDRDTNPPFYGLITAFDALTGVPVLLNTSFNVRGQPIVCTPDEAVDTYMTTGLDALALGPFLVQKTDRAAGDEAASAFERR